MDKNRIGSGLNLIGKEIIYNEETDSTNEDAKNIIDPPEGLVIISDYQRKGRGRLGRNWLSNKNDGVYMSIIVRPQLDKIDVRQITLITGLSVCSGIEKTVKLTTGLKWPNDIIINGKKVCGILAELKYSKENNFIIIGIGINANNKNFPKDLEHKATSLFLESQNFIDRDILARNVLKEFEKYYLLFKKTSFENFRLEYKEKCLTVGKEIRIIEKGIEKVGVALDIGNDGGLVVSINKKIETISSGEVSVRAKDGYI